MTKPVAHSTRFNFTREVDAATLKEGDVIYYIPLGVGEVRQMYSTLSVVIMLSSEVYFTVPSLGPIRHTRHLAEPSECHAALRKLNDSTLLSVVNNTLQRQSKLTEARQLLYQGDIENVTKAVILLRDDDSTAGKWLCTLALSRLLDEISIVLEADKTDIAQRAGVLELAQTHRLI